ncbi:trehalase family glycosidase [Halomicrococcus gelatinilyticus]|uniref:trehalase family glycosidase n=1 Tax=Halomicrococcus gelatinilyticus TaxID=1702103 RepID=UPI002E0EB40D
MFDDQKTFADAIPGEDPAVIEERFDERRDSPDFDLAEFVETHFHVPEPIDVDVDESAVDRLDQYIDRLWSSLSRTFDGNLADCGTRISLPEPHVVPGGRFREMYYWDSYFIAEGLAASGRIDPIEDMVENFTSLIDRFGFIPLGNRLYYNSRSQVPLFYRILRLLERERGWSAIRPHVPRLEREYEFWTAGSDELQDADGWATHRRVVRTPDGTTLNRYWDDVAAPRPEAYDHDRELAASVPEADEKRLYRDVRAACESGWDFSSRWLRDPDDLSTIRTTELVPVDLNALLYGVESSLAEWLDVAGAPERARQYEATAASRRETIEAVCWNDEAEFYVDYAWTDGRPSERLTLAGVVPLFTGVASEQRAAAVARRLREAFLVDGGLLTTLHETGEQWDRPNGWAPLHWMAVVGLRRYGHDGLAAEITDRWLRLNRSVFDRTGEMVEKYDVCDGTHSLDHGEYRLQYGFGWTNGVVMALRQLRATDDGGVVEPSHD